MKASQGHENELYKRTKATWNAFSKSRNEKEQWLKVSIFINEPGCLQKSLIPSASKIKKKKEKNELLSLMYDYRKKP